MKKLLPFFALIVLAAVPTRAHAAVDYVLSSTGALQCNDTSHATPGFPVQSFSLGGSDPAVTGTSGSGAGRISLSALSITRSFDGCSESLVRAFLGQARVTALTLKAYRTAANGSPVAILTITLSNAVISSYQLNGGGGSLPEEAVSFSYDKVNIESTIVNPDGTLGGTVKVTYDVKANKLD